jgi:hypothetical protein
LRLEMFVPFLPTSIRLRHGLGREMGDEES